MGDITLSLKWNKAYKGAFQSAERYRILYGGAGSGKSHFVAQEIVWNMLNNGSFYYLAVRKTSRSLRHSVFQLIQEIIRAHDLDSLFTVNKTEMSVTCATGAKLITSGLDDVDKLKSITGINRIWIEEASEISEGDFYQLDLRLRGQSAVGYQLTLTFNPISELHWLKKSFFDIGKEDTFILKTTYKDNPFLDERYKKTLQDLEKEDYQYYRIYTLGDWGSLGNLIYTNWEKADLTEKIDINTGKRVPLRDTFDNYFNGLDFGFAEDPTAFIRVHYDKKHKTIYITDEVYQQGLFIDELAAEIGGLVSNEIVTCDSSEPRSIADLNRNGIKARGAKKGQGSVEHGIKWIQGHKIVVDKRCVNTIKELSSYKWREDKDGNIIPRPMDADNHLLDALRYALEGEMLEKKLRARPNKLI